MDVSTIFRYLSFMLSLAVVVMGGVWTVSKISSTTAVLANSIKNLDDIIKKSGEIIDRIGKKQDEHEKKIAVIEYKLEKR